jgi:hypothetical protein
MLEERMTADRVRELIAQQRAVEAQNAAQQGETTFGDVAVAIVVAPVLAWAVIDMIVRLMP